MPHEMGLQISHRVGSKIPAEGAVRPVTAGTWGSLPRFGTAKGQPDFGRTFTTRPYPCVDLDPPKYSVAQVVGFIKGKGAIYIARAYLEQKKNYGGMHFGARGYYVSTVGVDEEVIRNYIRNQDKEDQKLDELMGK